MQEESSESKVSRKGIPQAPPLSLDEIQSIVQKKLGIRETRPNDLEQEQREGLINARLVTIWNTSSLGDLTKEYNYWLSEFVGKTLGLISPISSIHWREYKDNMTLDSYLSKRFAYDLPTYEIIDDSNSKGKPSDTEDYKFGASTQMITPERILNVVLLDEKDMALIREIYKDKLSLPINTKVSINTKIPEKVPLYTAVLIDIEDVLKNKVLASLRSVINPHN